MTWGYENMTTQMKRREVLKAVPVMFGVAGWLAGQETLPVGPTKADQQRNTELLSGYDYKKFPAALTGFTGQYLQRIGFLRYPRSARPIPRIRGRAGVDLLREGNEVNPQGLESLERA